jgi:hypothetical protein
MVAVRSAVVIAVAAELGEAALLRGFRDELLEIPEQLSEFVTLPRGCAVASSKNARRKPMDRVTQAMTAQIHQLPARAAICRIEAKRFFQQTHRDSKAWRQVVNRPRCGEQHERRKPASPPWFTRPNALPEGR